MSTTSSGLAVMKMKTLEEEDDVKSSQAPFQNLSNVVKRVIFGILMISGFLTIIYLGPLMLMLLAFIIQVLCFNEILKIGYDHNKIPPSVPFFRCLSWYFHLAANYFFSIETVAPHFQDIYKKNYYLSIMVKYHRFISFCIYFVGIILFVVNLVRKHDLKQFKILAWTHTLLIIIVLQSYMIIENIFNGLIWLILPVSLVIINDIFAYVFGRLCGKNPLIKLSPKKTWEGFVGGIIGTFVTGYVLANWMCQLKYFICPIEYHDTGYGIRMSTECIPNYLFTLKTYSVGPISTKMYPFMIHFLSLALFASIIAPFGGFCASGFKRAFNLKHFGGTIPGHGGIMDRFDCQFLMATFVNVYVFTFVRSPSVQLLFEKIMQLNDDSKVQFYYLLKDALQNNGYYANSTFL